MRLFLNRWIFLHNTPYTSEMSGKYVTYYEGIAFHISIGNIIIHIINLLA